MSCRVLGRGIEEAFLSSVTSGAHEAGAKDLELAFESTEKNKPAKDFLDKHTALGTLAVADFNAPEWVTIKKLKQHENI